MLNRQQIPPRDTLSLPSSSHIRRHSWARRWRQRLRPGFRAFKRNGTESLGVPVSTIVVPQVISHVFSTADPFVNEPANKQYFLRQKGTLNTLTDRFIRRYPALIRQGWMRYSEGSKAKPIVQHGRRYSGLEAYREVQGRNCPVCRTNTLQTQQSY